MLTYRLEMVADSEGAAEDARERIRALADIEAASIRPAVRRRYSLRVIYRVRNGAEARSAAMMAQTAARYVAGADVRRLYLRERGRWTPVSL